MPTILDKNQFTAADLVALAKIDAQKDARDCLSPGDYENELTVRMTYNMHVGEDFDRKSSVKASVPWQRIATLLLSKVNEATMSKVMEAAVDPDYDEATAGEISKRAQQAVEQLVAASVTTSTCKGRVTCALHVENVTVPEGTTG